MNNTYAKPPILAPPIVEVFASATPNGVGCNCTIVGDPDTRTAVVVDPGCNSELVLRRCEELGLRCGRCMITHAHVQQLLGVTWLKAQTGCDVFLHADDLPLYANVERQVVDFGVKVESTTMPHDSGMAVLPLPRPDGLVADGDVIQWAPMFTLRVIHTPGHSHGSVSYYFPEANLVCAGDTLACGAIARTSFPGVPSLQGTSNDQRLFASLKRLYALPGSTQVVTGHGDESNIGIKGTSPIPPADPPARVRAARRHTPAMCARRLLPPRVCPPHAHPAPCIARAGMTTIGMEATDNPQSQPRSKWH